MKPDTKEGVVNGLLSAVSALYAAIAGAYFIEGKWQIGLVWAVASLAWCVAVGIRTSSAYLKGHLAASRKHLERFLRKENDYGR